MHPDVKDRSVQATFDIAGFSISPSSATVSMAKGKTVDISVSLKNYGGGTLTGLTFTTESSTGITACIIPLYQEGSGVCSPSIVDEGVSLASGQTLNITFRVTSSATASSTGYATLTVSVNSVSVGNAELLTRTLDANITIVENIPVISTSPSYIDTGMVKGNQKIESFTISNTGQETLKNARLEGPSTSWMTLTIDKNIGDISAGGSKAVSLLLKPDTTITQGVYDDRITIYSDNHIPYTYQIQVTVTSNAVGNVMFDVLNELMEDVSGATITFQHQTTTELIYSLKTGADGTVMQYDIPEGRYSYN
ncbi:MAG: hypothetical protein HY755_05045, partial [Nitrospirae bacterium]|nr:hypothetical protein [Nitrospirota bacterium]